MKRQAARIAQTLATQLEAARRTVTELEGKLAEFERVRFKVENLGRGESTPATDDTGGGAAAAATRAAPPQPVSSVAGVVRAAARCAVQAYLDRQAADYPEFYVDGPEIGESEEQLIAAIEALTIAVKAHWGEP